MREINKKATKTFLKIVALSEASDEGYIKINNSGWTERSGGFMPVSFEKYREHEDYTIYTMAHTFVQNGDLMSDPRMEFLIFNHLPDMVFPICFEQHGIFGKYQPSVEFNEDGKVKGLRVKMQKDQAVFAGQWLKNIADQQNIK